MLSKTAWKRLLIIPPVLAGLAVMALALSERRNPEQAEPVEAVRPVRVIVVQPVDLVPRALGYGYVQPGSIWEAVAEVSGKIVYRHPDLEQGRLLQTGTVILRIDPTDYELAVARNQSDRDSVEAQLTELEVREKNTQASLAIERRALVLEEEDLNRKRQLLARGNASQATVDEAETSLLNQRQQLQDLENQLNLIPAERRVLDASLALADVRLREAERDLERTTIRLPFDARIADVTVEATQFVSTGQMMVVADSIDVAEVSAQFPIDRVRPLIPPGAELSTLSTEELTQLPQRFGLSAEVRLVSGDFQAVWNARFDRAGDTIDPETRTLGLIVAVDEPYRQAIPGQRPPLTKNMYVEVEVRAPVRDSQIVVPRVAVHQGLDREPVVYLADAENRLVLRPVSLGPVQSDFVVVEQGLTGGERVLVSDLIPAIEGMLLEPSEDQALAARLLDEASGNEALR